MVDLAYILGSMLFAIGSVVALWMYKREQYGLGFIPEFNLGHRTKEPAEFMNHMQSQYGCGRANVTWARISKSS